MEDYSEESSSLAGYIWEPETLQNWIWLGLQYLYFFKFPF